MLRTSLRIGEDGEQLSVRQFLSSNAQDFIEEIHWSDARDPNCRFLSSNAQDFIEEITTCPVPTSSWPFLSSNAQDFIEESYHLMIRIKSEIPEQ